MIKELVLLGDSHLARTNENAGEALVPHFSQAFPDMHITNLAQGGVDTNYGLNVISKVRLPSSFIALVLFGTNDAAPWKQVPLDKFTENYQNIITILKTKGASKIILITSPPVNPQKQVPPGRSNVDLSEYSKVVRDLAVKYRVACIDLFAILSEKMKIQDVHFSDGVHLNSVGYDIFFNQITPLLH